MKNFVLFEAQRYKKISFSAPPTPKENSFPTAAKAPDKEAANPLFMPGGLKKQTAGHPLPFSAYEVYWSKQTILTAPAMLLPRKPLHQQGRDDDSLGCIRTKTSDCQN